MLRERAALPCREVVEMVTDYLEGAMPRTERRRLERHLAGCAHCHEYLDQMRTTIRLTGRLREDDLTPAMRGELVSLYRRWLAEPGA